MTKQQSQQEVYHKLDCPKRIKIPKKEDKYFVQDLLKDGKYVPQEIIKIYYFTKGIKQFDIVEQLILVILNYYKKDYYSNRNDNISKNVLVFMCKYCGKKILVSIDADHCPIIEIEQFDQQKHSIEIEADCHRKSDKITVAIHNLLNVSINMISKDIILEIFGINTSEQSLDEIKQNKYSVEEYLFALKQLNENLYYSFKWEAVHMRNQIFTSKVIHTVSVVLPTVKNIHFLPNLIGIDATFHQTNLSTTIYLTGLDHNNQLILLGMAIGQTESNEVVGLLLSDFKNQLIQYGYDTKKFVFMSDRGQAIISSINTIFPENQHCYCAFHLVKNLISFLNKNNINISSSNNTIKIILAEFHQMCITCDISNFIGKMKKIISIIFSFTYEIDYYTETKEKNDDTIERIAKYIENYNGEEMIERVNLYNHIVNLIIQFMFDQTDPETYLAVCMNISICRFNHTTNQFSESMNNSKSDTKTFETTEQIHYVVWNEYKNIQNRKQLKLMPNNDSVGLKELQKLEVLIKLKSEIVVSTDVNTIFCDIGPKECKVCTLVIKYHINKHREVYYRLFCECGIPQNSYMKCCHAMYLDKKMNIKKIIIDNICFEESVEIFSIDDILLNDENYCKYYDSVQMKVANLTNDFIKYNEYVITDTKKNHFPVQTSSIYHSGFDNHDYGKGEIIHKMTDIGKKKIDENEQYEKIKNKIIETIDISKELKNPFFVDKIKLKNQLSSILLLPQPKLHQTKQIQQKSSKFEQVKEKRNEKISSKAKCSKKICKKKTMKQNQQLANESLNDLDSEEILSDVLKQKQSSRNVENEQSDHSISIDSKPTTSELSKMERRTMNEFSVHTKYDYIVYKKNPDEQQIVNDIKLFLSTQEHHIDVLVGEFFEFLKPNEKEDCDDKFKTKKQNIKLLKDQIKGFSEAPNCMGMLSSLESSYFDRYINYLLQENKKIMKISNEHCNILDIKQKIDNSHCELVLYEQFDFNSRDKSATADEYGGHWILNVLEKNTKTIFILNSLSTWKPKAYRLHEVFPDYEVVEVYMIQQKGVTCGFWMYFYIFIIVYFTSSIQGISNIVIRIQSFFESFKKFVKQFTEKLKELLLKYECN